MRQYRTVNREIWFPTSEVFWVGNGVRQLLVTLDLRWHRCHHHAIWELLLDAAGKVLLPVVKGWERMGGSGQRQKHSVIRA